MTRIVTEPMLEAARKAYWNGYALCPREAFRGAIQAAVDAIDTQPAAEQSAPSPAATHSRLLIEGAAVLAQLRAEAASMRQPEGSVVAELADRLARALGVVAPNGRLDDERVQAAVDVYAQWMTDSPIGLKGPALLREAMRDAIRAFLGVRS